MSTVLLVGMISGVVYAVDLKQDYLEKRKLTYYYITVQETNCKINVNLEWRKNKSIVNTLRSSPLMFFEKNEDCQEAKKMSDDNDCHLTMLLCGRYTYLIQKLRYLTTVMYFLEHFYAYYDTYYGNELSISISNLLFIKEINIVVIGYSTGHFQLMDCKTMSIMYVFFTYLLVINYYLYQQQLF